MKMRSLLPALATLLLASNVYGLELKDVSAALPRFTEIIDEAIARGDVPGIAVAVVYKDEVVYLKGFGVREAGRPEVVGPDTRFPLASVSKAIASSAVAALVGDGLVDWDTAVSEVIPSFRFYDPYVTQAVTIRDLFSHRSGLAANAGNDLQLLGYGRDEILIRLALLAPQGGFRAGHIYSNYGLTLGAVAAAHAAGMDWEDVAEQRLYKPLGMTRTSSRFDDFLAADDRVSLHTIIDGTWKPAPDPEPDAASPAGGVSSTARDLAAWMRTILAEGKFEGHQVIDAAALAETETPVVPAGISPVTGNPSFYGLGWSIDTDAHGTHVSHNGGFTGGVRTLVDLIPDEEIGIAILTNSYPNGVPEGLAMSFYDLAFTGKVEGDPVARFNSFLTNAYGQFLAMMSDPLRTPPPVPTAALPNEAYLGTYVDGYLGEARVIETGEGLAILMGPGGSTSFPLHHYDRDTFYIAPDPASPRLLFPVSFTVGPDQNASEVGIAMVGGPGHERLRRQVTAAGP